MSNRLLSPVFLFHIAAPLRARRPLWSGVKLGLDESYRLLHFGELDEQQRSVADVRGAWSEEGLAFSVLVTGKQQLPWCRETRPLDSDGLALWIDTRDTHNIHRASRFCHHFRFLPAGGGQRLEAAVGDQLLVDRARENARPIRPGMLRCRSERLGDGYLLEVAIPAGALTGFDPVEHPKLGFTYALFDREIGVQTFATGTELPIDSDPSLWSTLELVSE